MTEELTNVITDNQNLIYSMTHYFNGYKNKEDLYQVGVIGLINAYKRYQNNYGVKFTTYAYPYILGEMKKCVREDKGIKISRDITKLHLKIEKASVLLAQRFMREPTIKEISYYLEIPESYITEALKTTNIMQSLDEPIIINNGSEMSFYETIGDSEEFNLYNIMQIQESFSSLTPFERTIIYKRYMEDLTQSEVAKFLGISQVQVSRNEQKILNKMRNKLIN